MCNRIVLGCLRSCFEGRRAEMVRDWDSRVDLRGNLGIPLYVRVCCHRFGLRVRL